MTQHVKAMTMDSSKTAQNSLALEFKSSTFSVPVLMLFATDLDVIEQQLTEKIRLAPEFFKDSPIVFDVHELNKQELNIDISSLIDLIRRAGLLPIGIRGGVIEQNAVALALQVPQYSSHNTVTSTIEPPKTKANLAPLPEAKAIMSTLITQPIRSGQRIYAEGDLVVLAQVSAGAEIMAEGNIHVYNSLRGRALAGVQGDVNARIFCFDLQAELISIAGNYKISEDLNSTARNKPVQIYLQDNTLIIKDIV